MILRIPLEFCSWECWEEFGNSFATYVFDNAWSWAGRHSTGPQWWQSFFGVTATFGWGQIHHQHPLFNSSNGPSVDLARQCHLQSFAWVPRWQAGSNRWLMNWGATTCLSTRLCWTEETQFDRISHKTWRSRCWVLMILLINFCVFLSRFDQWETIYIWPTAKPPGVWSLLGRTIWHKLWCLGEYTLEGYHAWGLVSIIIP